MIDEGQIRIERPTTGGDAEQLALLSTGEIFGEMALITDRPRGATATAQSKSRAWRIPKKAFLRHLDDSPKLQQALHQVVTQRVQHDEERDTHADEEEAMEWSREAQLGMENRMPRDVSLEERAAVGGEHSNSALAIWLGIGLDAIPESLVIGMLVVQAAAAGTSFSMAFIAGVFLANLPEAMSSSVTMKDSGLKVPRILLMWGSLCVMTALGAMLGAWLLPPHPEGIYLYFVFCMEVLAGGAMLTMIAQIMLPEAFEQGGGPTVGLATLGGFLAALLVKLTA